MYAITNGRYFITVKGNRSSVTKSIVHIIKKKYVLISVPDARIKLEKYDACRKIEYDVLDEMLNKYAKRNGSLKIIK